MSVKEVVHTLLYCWAFVQDDPMNKIKIIIFSPDNLIRRLTTKNKHVFDDVNLTI